MTADSLSPQEITDATRELAVTVVVPAYNSADTLSRTMDSLLAQTFDDFAVLVIDDGSAENMLDLLPDDPRSLGYRLSRNQGYAAVTNHALEMIASRWTIFVDSDDTIAPECLEVLVDRGEREHSDIVVLPLSWVHPSGTRVVPPHPMIESPLSGDRALRKFIDGRFRFTQHLLFRPNHVRAAANTYSDLSFVFALMSAAERVSFEPRCLYNCYIRAGSVTSELRPTIWDLATVLDDVEDTLFETYRGKEAVEAIHRMRWMQLNHMVAKAGDDTELPGLQAEVYNWCREQIRFSHVVDALRIRHPGKGLSLVLAKLSPTVHSRAYRLRSRFKERV
ncbi:glycosyltransferase involved in cell wall biosynthesis [Brevibacterium epidermidis]|jgi:glycosyltransferase involved in cell wall biosynthesis|uniref:Glycosyltransferase involved in cell wall biosynthesis n=1 Tax=Brevibacterium epidermidis TaxID=1698 RepID=A0ABV4EGJ9_BREEP